MKKELLNILACPSCKAKLILDEESEELICRFERLAYPLRDGVPVLVVERTRKFNNDVADI